VERHELLSVVGANTPLYSGLMLLRFKRSVRIALQARLFT